MLRYITFPLALPAILTGLRIGISGGWIGIVSAEMLGSSAGLGYAVLAYSQSFQFPAMYAAIVMIAVCGLALNQSLLAVQTLLKGNCCEPYLVRLLFVLAILAMLLAGCVARRQATSVEFKLQ